MPDTSPACGRVTVARRDSGAAKATTPSPARGASDTPERRASMASSATKDTHPRSSRIPWRAR